MLLKKAIKTYGIVKNLMNYQGSYLLPNGKLLDLDDCGHRDLGIYKFCYDTNSLRIRVIPEALSIDLHIEFIPTDSQWQEIEFLSYNKELRVTILNKNEDILYSNITKYSNLKTIYEGLRW